MLQSFLKKKKKEEPEEKVHTPIENKVYAPIDGIVTKIEEISDPIFADKVLGDGVCIVPSSDTVYSPINGCITGIADTKHAVGILADDGAEIMIHIGLDSVELGGRCFDMKVKEGQRIVVGDVLCKVNFDMIMSSGYSTETALLVINGKEFKIKDKFNGIAKACETSIFTYVKVK